MLKPKKGSVVKLLTSFFKGQTGTVDFAFNEIDGSEWFIVELKGGTFVRIKADEVEPVQFNKD